MRRALSSARLERRSYMTTRHIWRESRLTGGRRFKSARAHFSYIYTIFLFFVILLTPYILLTTFNFSYIFVKFISEKDDELLKNIFFCISSNYDCDYLSKFGLTKEEISHLIDVKNFLNSLRIFYFLCLFISLILFFLAEINEKLFFILLIIFILFFLFSLLNFDFCFEIFHKIFFVRNYSFPSSNLLIKIFPQKFFILSYILSSVFSFVLFFTFFCLRKINKKFKK